MKITKSFLVMILVFCISCKESKPKIGYLCWNGSNEIALKILNSFKEKTSQINVEVLDKDAHNNEKNQYDQTLEMIAQGVKVFVIKPVNSTTAGAIVRKIHENGGMVIANDQLIKNCELDYYMTFDSRKVGEYMAREALLKKPTGNYVLLWGDKSDDNADLVKSGVLKILQPQIDKGNIKIIYSNYIEDWSQENAEIEMDYIIRLSCKEKIDAFIGSCDDITRGAISVLKRYNMLENTFTAGQNADIETLKMIMQNEQTITISKSPKTVGYELAELAAKLVSKSNTKLDLKFNDSIFNGFHKVPSILFDPVVVNKSNLEKIAKDEGINLK